MLYPEVFLCPKTGLPKMKNIMIFIQALNFLQQKKLASMGELLKGIGETYGSQVYFNCKTLLNY